MYTIGQASAASGVPAVTIRAWERRYDLLHPTRSAGGYRLYTEADVAVLRRMASVVAGGAPAGRAAELVWSQSESGPSVVLAGSLDAASAHPSDLVGLTRTLDEPGIAAALDSGLGRLGLDALVDDWLMPQLVRLGEAWAAGSLDVAHEHFASACVQRWLSRSHDQLAVSGGPVVVLGLPAGSRHELGLLSLACLLRSRGLTTIHLGADVPVDSWAGFVASSGARAVITSATRQDDVEPARQVRAALESPVPAPQVWIGGAHGDDTPRLGGRLGLVAETMSQELLAPAVHR